MEKAVLAEVGHRFAFGIFGKLRYVWQRQYQCLVSNRTQLSFPLF